MRLEWSSEILHLRTFLGHTCWKKSAYMIRSISHSVKQQGVFCFKSQCSKLMIIIVTLLVASYIEKAKLCPTRFLC